MAWLEITIDTAAEKIKATLETIDRSSFERAADVILSAKNIYILGMRSSATLAEFMNYYFGLLFDNVRLIRQTATPTESYGKSRLKTFLLIIPGDVPLQPGDRIFDGIGPVEVDWAGFVPALVPEVYELSFAKPCYWEGKIAHWEAGHRKEAV